MRLPLLALAAAAACKGTPDVADLTYFSSDVVAKFSDCSKPPCKAQLGKTTWSVGRLVVSGTTAFDVPPLRTTNQYMSAAPTLTIAGRQARPHANANDVSLLDDGSVVNEYISKDVPCVSHATCQTQAIEINGAIVCSVYSICYDLGAAGPSGIDPKTIVEARDVQVGRMPNLGTNRVVTDETPGSRLQSGTGTRVSYNGQMLVGVNGNISASQPQFDSSSITGCVNTFVVIRGPVTESLFKKYDAERDTEKDLKDSTVPH